MSISEAIKIIKEIGLKRFFRTVSSIAGFLLPFVGWIVILQLFGQALFRIDWAIPGLVILIFASIIILLQMHYAFFYEFQLMRRIEHARNIFDNPADPDSEKQVYCGM